jgi:outer membrane protein TolC
LRQEKLVLQRQGQVELARQQLEQIQAQVDEGLAARVDVQPVLVNLSQARFDLATAENALRTATTNFRNALGLGRGPVLRLQDSSAAFETVAPQTPLAQAPNAEAPVTAAPGTVEPAAPDVVAPNVAVPEFPTQPNVPAPVVPVLQNLDEYVAEARRLRPDLLQARANVQSTEASRSLAKIAQRPQISASAGYDIDPRSIRDRGFQVGVGVSIPIFDAGGRRADVRAADAELEASQIRLAQLDKDVAADVEATYVDIAGQVDRIANARVLVEAARTNLATATERYRLGLGVVLDIVNAQTQLFNAQTSATQAVYDYELSRSDLDRAVGRFAWADPGLPVPAQAPTQVTKTVPIATSTAPITVLPLAETPGAAASGATASVAGGAAGTTPAVEPPAVAGQ